MPRTCPRCLKPFRNISYLRRHFSRKRQCQLAENGVPLDDDVIAKVLNKEYIFPEKKTPGSGQNNIIQTQNNNCHNTNIQTQNNTQNIQNIVNNYIIPGNSSLLTCPEIVELMRPYVEEFKHGKSTLDINGDRDALSKEDVFKMVHHLTETTDKEKFKDAFYAYDHEKKIYLMRVDKFIAGGPDAPQSRPSQARSQSPCRRGGSRCPAMESRCPVGRGVARPVDHTGPLARRAAARELQWYGLHWTILALDGAAQAY
eukprot:362960-Chlamydomonas_euryale.AAC.2